MRKKAFCLALTLIMVLTLAAPVTLTSAASDALASADFEDGTAMGFEGRGTTEVLTVSQDVAHSGSNSLLVSERTQAWNGPSFRIESLIEPLEYYTITFWVHAKSPASSSFKVSTQIGEGDSARYINLLSKTVKTDDGWVEFTIENSYDEVVDYMTVYLENDTADAEFYIDDFSFAVAGTSSNDGAASVLPAPITGNRLGKIDGFDYEFWSQNPDSGTMWLTGGGTFHCQWDGHNILFRTGKKLGSVSTYNEYGDVHIDYDGTFNTTRGDVTYLTVYGWTQNPLMEWYIVENRGNYRPGSVNRGQIEVDGGLYDVYTDTRVEQPSIEGTKTFEQIYSIRVGGRSSGTITVSDHFKAWEGLGLDVSGGLYEVSMCVEGFASAGNAAITKMVMTIGDEVYGSENDYMGPPEGLEPDPEPTPEPVDDTAEPTDAPEATEAPAEATATLSPAQDSDNSGGGLPWWLFALAVAAGAVVGVAVYFTKKKKGK